MWMRHNASITSRGIRSCPAGVIPHNNHAPHRTLTQEFIKLYELRDDSLLDNIRDDNDGRVRALAIFDNANEARVQFEVHDSIRIDNFIILILPVRLVGYWGPNVQAVIRH